jgi:uroporphyrinogen-III synthase
VLQVDSVPVDPPRAIPQAIVFTSGHGIRHLPEGAGWREVPVFAVGDYTPDAATASGYRNVRTARDGKDLLAQLATKLPRGARLLLFGAGRAAEDLGDGLRRGGYEVEFVKGYATRPSTDFEIRDALEMLPDMDGICVYSPKGARRVAEVLNGRSGRPTIFCLSHATAEAFSPKENIRIEVAEQPTDRALFQLARRRWSWRT